MKPEIASQPLTRRQLLKTTGTGLGMIALPNLLRAANSPLSAKEPHFPAKAKHVIHI